MDCIVELRIHRLAVPHIAVEAVDVDLDEVWVLADSEIGVIVLWQMREVFSLRIAPRWLMEYLGVLWLLLLEVAIECAIGIGRVGVEDDAVSSRTTIALRRIASNAALQGVNHRPRHLTSLIHPAARVFSRQKLRYMVRSIQRPKHDLHVNAGEGGDG